MFQATTGQYISDATKLRMRTKILGVMLITVIFGMTASTLLISSGMYEMSLLPPILVIGMIALGFLLLRTLEIEGTEGAPNRGSVVE